MEIALVSVMVEFSDNRGTCGRRCQWACRRACRHGCLGSRRRPVCSHWGAMGESRGWWLRSRGAGRRSAGGGRCPSLPGTQHFCQPARGPGDREPRADKPSSWRPKPSRFALLDCPRRRVPDDHRHGRTRGTHACPRKHRSRQSPAAAPDLPVLLNPMPRCSIQPSRQALAQAWSRVSMASADSGTNSLLQSRA